MLHSLGDRIPQLIGEDHFVAPNASVIGSVILHPQASVWFNVVIRGDNELMVIGERTNVQDGAVLHTDAGVPFALGRGVTIGHQAMLHGCVVGDNSLIGIQAVVLNRAVIGKNCLIGSGALITEGKVIPDGSVVIGSPGKIVRPITDGEIAWMQSNADLYVENARRYLQELHALQ
ncbi:MAG: gamma carbonic anhydrase family protein [Betaproteobacteria bacterium]|nr:gamma carbonic anhydrase family protein [Betaproteobacteria bacterium]